MDISTDNVTCTEYKLKHTFFLNDPSELVINHLGQRHVIEKLYFTAVVQNDVSGLKH